MFCYFQFNVYVRLFNIIWLNTLFQMHQYMLQFTTQNYCKLRAMTIIIEPLA